MARFVFITGGVVSSLGKGLASAALGALLMARGYTVRLRKLDPYLNVDPGTMSPYQHGEVFVTDDGFETDLDLGHYERFTGITSRRCDSVSAGRVYQDVISKERRGDYLGGTVQVIPHVTDAIKRFVLDETGDADFVLVEVGGTVGDIEGLPFYEALRQLRNDLPARQAIFLHLTLLPYIASAGELKTKPTQHSVKELRSIGIQPDILLCRSERPIPKDERKKIALFCNVRENAVIEALDVSNIYDAPQAYNEAGLDREVLAAFGISPVPRLKMARWTEVGERLRKSSGEVTIAVVGKYTGGMKDAYKSLVEALAHGGLANKTHVKIEWVDAELLESQPVASFLSHARGIIVPGGFGRRGAEGKIAAIRYARENGIPYFGICLGMQMAVIEAARNLAGLPSAGSTEFGPCVDPVIDVMRQWESEDGKQIRDTEGDLGGTMRLGSYPAILADDSRLAKIYAATNIDERHRHRFEVNMAYRDQIEGAGLIFTGMSPDGLLPETVERRDHPWFVGVQYHPELKSRPFAPHPLFASFIGAAVLSSTKIYMRLQSKTIIS